MNIGFYGFGHMASALVTGLLKKEIFCPDEITVLAKSEQTMDRARALDFAAAKDAKQLFDCTDIVILALKPSVFRDLAPALKGLKLSGKRVVSLMASVGLEELKEVFPCPVLRIMPTMASETGRDIIGITDPEGFEDLAEKLRGLGSLHVLDEEQLDRLTVAASCGPGFAAKILYSYQKACQELGFSKEQAVAITSAVFSFAATRQGEEPFLTLEEQVATKGGVTEAGNRAMGEDVKIALDRTFGAALEKARPQK